MIGYICSLPPMQTLLKISTTSSIPDLASNPKLFQESRTWLSRSAVLPTPDWYNFCLTVPACKKVLSQIFTMSRNWVYTLHSRTMELSLSVISTLSLWTMKMKMISSGRSSSKLPTQISLVAPTIYCPYTLYVHMENLIIVAFYLWKTIQLIRDL